MRYLYKKTACLKPAFVCFVAILAMASTAFTVETYDLDEEVYETELLWSQFCLNQNRMWGGARPRVYNGNVYVLYVDPSDRPWVAKIPLDGSPATEALLFSELRVTQTIGNDNHRSFELIIDNQGYIHVVGDMHGEFGNWRYVYANGPGFSGVNHWVSDRPGDVSSFTKTHTPYCPAGTRPTYPELQKDRNGKLYNPTTRIHGLNNRMAVGVSSMDDATGIWTMLGADIPSEFGGQSNRPVTAWGRGAEGADTGYSLPGISIAFDNDNRLHLLARLLKWTPAERGGHWFSHVVYAWSDDGGETFYKADGTPVQLPMMPDEGPHQGDILYASPEGVLTLKGADIRIDNEGKPVIQVKSRTTGTHTFRLESNAWVEYSGMPFWDMTVDAYGVMTAKIGREDGFTRFWGPGEQRRDVMMPMYKFDPDYLRDTGDLVFSQGYMTGTIRIYRTSIRRPGVVAPAAPTGLVAAFNPDNALDLSWTDNAENETGFKIERKTGTDGDWVQIGMAGPGFTRYRDSGAVPHTFYVYRIRAYNAAGDSAYSNEDSVIQGSWRPEVGLTAPADGAAFASGVSSVSISADAMDPDGEVVQVEFFRNGESIGVDADGTDAWSATWAAPPDGQYEITAVATDNEGVAGVSLPATLTVGTWITLEADSDTVAENGTGAVFTVTRAAPDTVGDIVVGFSMGGSAVEGVDYTLAPSGSVTIPDGSRTATVALQPVDEDVLRAPRYAVITLSSASVGSPGTPSSAQVTITDDEKDRLKNQVWQGGGGNERWSDSLNWSPSPVWGDATHVIFNASGAGFLTNRIQNNYTIGYLTFNDNADADITIMFRRNTGAPRNLTMGGPSTRNPTLTVYPGAPGSYNIGGPWDGSGNLVLAGDLNITHEGDGILTFGQRITQEGGSRSVTLDGTGTVVFNAANTYTGETAILGGRLQLGNANALASSAAVSLAPGAVLDTTGLATYAIPAGQLLTIGVDASTGDAIGIHAAGLDISSASVTFEAYGLLQAEAYVLAGYTSLTGASFASVSGLPVGYTIDYDYGGNQIALVPVYAEWEAAGAFGADSSGDGIPNGMAFLLGAPGPNERATGHLPVVEITDEGVMVLNFPMRNAAHRGDKVLHLEYSTDLGVWTSVPVPDTSSGPTQGVTFIITPGDPLNTVEATISSEEAPDGKIFSRLRAIRP